MKKYRIIIALFTGFYLILAVTMYFAVNHLTKEQNNEYRVEISRFCRGFENSQIGKQKNNGIIILNKNEYGRVTHIVHAAFIGADVNDGNLINGFYASQNNQQMEIVPVFNQKQLTGYIRFDYKKNIDVSTYNFIAQICLLLVYLFAVSILVYTEQNIIKVFHQLSEMPYELSKGNLNHEIKESKNRYFGRFIWGIGMLKDTLEEHKSMELKLARDKKMLLLSISHDIKTPLNAINLYAKALEQGIYETEEEKDEAVIKIQEKAAEINTFVKEIIKSSTEDIITIEVNNSEYYLTELVHKVESGYSEKCRLCKMEFEIGPFENHLLKGDMERMYEAIGNLIENAFKYGDGKRLAITFTEEDYCVLIQVYNSGLPVSDHELSHLFDSFYRGSNTEGKAGNGLGLYICRQLMKKMDGDAFARQRKDGMEFVLVCPMS